MNMNDAIEFANQNPATWLATLDNGTPRVRGMLMWFADETGFYFHTASVKSLPQQLDNNPVVEAAFHWNEGGMGKSRMLRVSGTVEFVKDPVLEQRLYEERPWILANREVMPPGTVVRIFRIAHGFCHMWTQQANGREAELPRASF